MAAARWSQSSVVGCSGSRSCQTCRLSAPSVGKSALGRLFKVVARRHDTTRTPANKVYPRTASVASSWPLPTALALWTSGGSLVFVADSQYRTASKSYSAVPWLYHLSSGATEPLHCSSPCPPCLPCLRPRSHSSVPVFVAPATRHSPRQCSKQSRTWPVNTTGALHAAMTCTVIPACCIRGTRAGITTRAGLLVTRSASSFLTAPKTGPSRVTDFGASLALHCA